MYVWYLCVGLLCCIVYNKYEDTNIGSERKIYSLLNAYSGLSFIHIIAVVLTFMCFENDKNYL